MIILEMHLTGTNIKWMSISSNKHLNVYNKRKQRLRLSGLLSHLIKTKKL